MSYDPNAAVDRRLIEVIFWCAPLPGMAVVNQAIRQGGVSAQGASILAPRPLGRALRLPPHSQLICGVTAREEFDTSLRLSLVKLALVSTQRLRSRKWIKLNG